MKAKMLILAALAMTSIAAYAHDDAHWGMMQGMMHRTVEFTCVQPGHLAAGMMGKV